VGFVKLTVPAMTVWETAVPFAVVLFVALGPRPVADWWFPLFLPYAMFLAFMCGRRSVGAAR
jgi:hypothetical protein